MKLDSRTLRLIAVGASVTANCMPCLEANATKALEDGADEQEIADAISVGRLVRQGAASKMDRYTASLSQAFATFSPSPDGASQGGCGCDAREG